MNNNVGNVGRVVMLSLSVMLAGCATTGSGNGESGRGEQSTQMIGKETPLGRANPGYIQWLERQSMLRQTPSLTSIVSGSTLGWRAPATDNASVSLLRLADVWFALSPRHIAWSGNASALNMLTSKNILGQLSALGMDGIILDPTAESGADWNAETSFAEQGHDTVSYRFSAATSASANADEEYATLEHAGQSVPNAIANTETGFLLGGSVLPSATGLGPDFFLAIRGVRDYPGLYMMVEAPQDVWDILPLFRLAGEAGNSEGKALSRDVTELLTAAGVLPPAFSRDMVQSESITLSPSGWAATSEIAGVDGVNRRWIYRWAGSPRRPVLNWDDPSGTAQRLLAASVIRQVGQLRQPLVMLSVEALWGQEAGATAGQTTLSPEPALSALRALSRDVRRYGAWSMLSDDMSASLLPLVLSSGVDFARDSITSPALEYAMLTADAEPLRQSLAAALRDKIPQERLWRSAASGKPFHFQRIGKKNNLDSLTDNWQNTLAGLPLTLNAFTLAAVAVGATPAELNSAAPPHAQQDGSVLQQVRDAHLLQIAFRMLQPGLFVLQSSDIAGMLDVPGEDRLLDEAYAPTTPFAPIAWAIDGSAQSVSKQGLAASAGLYPPLQTQIEQAGLVGSFGHSLLSLNTLRRDTRVAEGTVVAVPSMGEPAVASVLTRLPDGDFLLCAGNFSQESFTTDVTIPADLLPTSARALDLVTGKNVGLNKGHMRLKMTPWQSRIVRISGK